MSLHLLTLKQPRPDECRQLLQGYLPGLNLGLVPINPRRMLLPRSTWRALRIEYGAAGAEAILHRCGASGLRQVDDAAALRLLRQRDTSTLPPRPASLAGDSQWHIQALNVQAAWALFGGPDAIDWGAVRIGQIDTGYTRHSALGYPDASWVSETDGRTMFAAGADGGDPGPGRGIDPLASLMDGHGTRVASMICGWDPGAMVGTFSGVAPRAPLVPVRIANFVAIGHALDELAQALLYLVNEAHVSVINLSMGFLPRTKNKRLRVAINATYEAGVILVCAAGQPLSSVVAPAHGRRTIAVAGSTPQGTPWSSSAHGSAVDWSAPAVAIRRAQPGAPMSSAYKCDGDGTSYAAGASTGAAALWLAHHGSALDVKYPERWQRVEAFKAVARATSRPMPNQQPGSFGAGVLDVGALVSAALPAAAGLVPEAPA